LDGWPQAGLAANAPTYLHQQTESAGESMMPVLVSGGGITIDALGHA